MTARATLTESDRLEMERFAAWVAGVRATRDRRACWTPLGLEYIGITRAQALALDPTGWSVWPGH